MNNSWHAPLIRLAALTLAGVLSVAVHLLMANAVHGLWNHLQREEYFFSVWDYSCTVIYHPLPSLTLLAAEFLLALWGARESGRSGAGLLRQSIPMAVALVPLWYAMIFIGVFVIEVMSYRIAPLLQRPLPALLIAGVAGWIGWRALDILFWMV